MKLNLKQSMLIIACLIVGYSNILNAQSIYKIGASKSNDMKMSGTSTLHDWSMSAKNFTGAAEFSFKPGNNNELVAIKLLTFSLPVANLKSGEAGLDKNAWKALKSDQYKQIVYQLISATVTPDKDNKYLLKTRGNLTITGVTKEISMQVYGAVSKDGELVSFNGTYKLNMTDYGIKRPTFMLGAMKTGDALTFNFTAVYEK